MNPESKSHARLELPELRERLRRAKGPAFWRSLDELAGTEAFAELLEREFPRLLPAQGEGLPRRRFLQLMGASMALAGLSACSLQPEEEIVPYVRQPEQIVPGKPLFYATARADRGFARGLLVESHMGRPTKIEGNPEHPWSLGGSDVFDQASVLGLYDPDRSTVPLHLGKIRSWKAFTADLRAALTAQEALGGAGLRLLLPSGTSPTLAAQLARVLERFPQARWTAWAPLGRDGIRQGARAAFGERVETHYDLSRADLIVTFDADLLTQGPGHVRYARQFGERRRRVESPTEPPRFYAVESAPTASGTLADHRLALPPHEVERMLVDVAAALGVPGVRRTGDLDEARERWLQTLVADLRRAGDRALVACGEQAAPAVHTLCHAIAERLGSVGSTVLHTDGVEYGPEDQESALAELAGEMRRGEVDVLLALGVNPVYDAPAELDFAAALTRVPFAVHLGMRADETAEYCPWHLPMSHDLEAWGDLRALDGTASIVQPLITPLYDSRSPVELLEMVLGADEPDGRAAVRATWAAEEDEKRWRRSLHDGVVEDTRPTPRPRRMRPGAPADASRALSDRHRSAGELTLVLRPDPTVGDGSFANNGWLQECPKPLSKLTWDNAVLLAPATAEARGLANGDVVRLEADGRAIEGPVWIQPGHAAGCVTVHAGGGRRRGGRLADAAGFDVHPLLTTGAFGWIPQVAMSPTGATHALASTQDHHSMEGRRLVREGTLEEYRHHPDFAHHGGHHLDTELSLYEGHEYEGYKWGMAIDLGACTGCNACVVACHSENNIAIVGKDEVLNGRELHWMRIDRYYEGDLDDPRAHHQPLMCQHCEQAPCEPVCPVSATVHSDEGLNDMVYNRCVGTRYCSNNCPYKVRRFNYYQYSDQQSESRKLGRNPDVTVRSRGVMEKCSFCVQRINQARIEAKTSDLPLGDGDVVTACQQACPTQAIRFGDLNDPEAEVTRWKASPLNYSILDELGTRPRTSYLAKVRNSHPELERS